MTVGIENRGPKFECCTLIVPWWTNWAGAGRRTGLGDTVFRGRLKGEKKVAEGCWSEDGVGEAGGKGVGVAEDIKGEGVAGANEGNDWGAIMGWGVVEAVKPVFCSGMSDNRRALAGAVLMEKSLMVSFLRGRF